MKLYFHQGPDRRESVAPCDLLALRKIPPVIRDRGLVEFVFALERLGKAVVLDHLSAPNLMSGRMVQSRIILAYPYLIACCIFAKSA